MINEFEKIRLFGSAISKDYAPDLLSLLYLYKDISASEAASRLGMHIRTIQEFFDTLHGAGIVQKQEVFESKRPYFRYRLLSNKINIELDIQSLLNNNSDVHQNAVFIREQKNANVRFSNARNNLYFSSVTIWIGEGRDRKEKKINLTNAQGKFLFNLPFPDADFLSAEQIMQKAGIDDDQRSEIMDIVNVLIEHNVVETK